MTLEELDNLTSCPICKRDHAVSEHQTEQIQTFITDRQGDPDLRHLLRMILEVRAVNPKTD